MTIKRIISYLRSYKIIESFCMLKQSINNSNNRMPIKISRKATVNILPESSIQLGKNAHFVYGAPSGEGYCRSSYLSIGKHGKLSIKGGFTIGDNAYCIIRSGAKLNLGSGYINSNAQIVVSECITIGDGVAIADGVLIRDSDDHNIQYDTYQKHCPITIGNHVWIGQNVTILKGVTIGDGSIIAAGAVVTKSIPEHCLAGGIPAIIIKEDIEWN